MMSLFIWQVRADCDYVFCATDSGDVVKVFVEPFIRMKTAATPNLSTLVVACAVKRAPKKSGMNAGKFIGGQFLRNLSFYNVYEVLACH